MRAIADSQQQAAVPPSEDLEVPGKGAPEADKAETVPPRKKRKAAAPAEPETPSPADATPAPWKPQQPVGSQNPETVIPKPKVPVLKARWSDGRKKTYLALVELFAGLRTTHLAARPLEDACIVMSHAAEKCEFANRLAAKNNVDETLHADV